MSKYLLSIEINHEELEILTIVLEQCRLNLEDCFVPHVLTQYKKDKLSQIECLELKIAKVLDDHYKRGIYKHNENTFL